MHGSPFAVPYFVLERYVRAALLLVVALGTAHAAEDLRVGCPYIERPKDSTATRNLFAAYQLKKGQYYAVGVGPYGTDYDVDATLFGADATDWYSPKSTTSKPVRMSVTVHNPSDQDMLSLPLTLYRKPTKSGEISEIDLATVYLYAEPEDPAWSPLWRGESTDDLDFVEADTLFAADLGNDGVDELFADFGGRVVVYAFDGASWAPWWTATTSYSNWTFGDFNGDGRDEVIAWLPDCSSAGLWRLSETTGPAFLSNLSGKDVCNYLAGGHDVLVGDFNGNGKEELMSTTGAWTTSWEYSVNKFKWQWSNYGDVGEEIHSYTDAQTAADIDGDGRDELVLSGEPGGPIGYWDWVGGSAGWSWVESMIWDSDTTGAALQVADLNGDGQEDLLVVGDTVTAYTWDGWAFEVLWDSLNCFGTGPHGCNNGYIHDFRVDDSDYPGMSGAWYLPVQATSPTDDARTALMAVRQRCDGDRVGLYQLE